VLQIAEPGEQTVEYTTILVERGDDGVATITLNRPEVMNAFNIRMCEEFKALWEDLKFDNDVRAIVMRANGDRAFCVGVDAKEGLPVPQNEWNWEDPGSFLGPKQNRVWKPVICAVHGMAAGGALYWLNESDIVICSDDTTIFDPHVNFGMVAASEPIGMFRRVPFQEITRMALLGRDVRMTAARAYQLGIVSEVVTRDELWPRAHELAALVASRPADAIQGTVRVLWDAIDMPRYAANSSGMIYPLYGNPRAEEELRESGQWQEGRKVRYVGR
jgi:enoyl-CoA hydratase/carnithine racemase